MPQLRRLVFVLGVCATCALGIARAADAVNYVPNPAFDSCSGGQPASWSAFGGATIACDTSNPHSAPNSLAVSGTGGVQGAESACVVVPPSTSITDFSMWYRTSVANVVQAAFSVLSYTSNDCSGSRTFASVGAGTSFVTPIVTDGAWHQVTGTHLIDSTINSVKFQLNFQCNPACTNATVNFDDLAYATAPLAATVRSLAASATPRGVRVQWRTASESDVLGFNVYRVRRGVRVCVNRALIRARGSVSGASYRLLDRRPVRGATYRLEIVHLDGTRTWHGSVRVSY